MLAKNRKYFNLIIASPHKILRCIPRVWRFVFGGLILACLLTGISPWNIFQTVTRALNDNTKTINLYAGECAPEAVSENYDQGWWNAEKAQGEPEAGPEESILAFSDTNSAFYAGGNYSLVCGEFMFLKNEPQDIAPEEVELIINDGDESAGTDEMIIGDEETTESGQTNVNEEGNVEDRINEIIENNSEIVSEEPGGDDNNTAPMADPAEVEIVDEGVGMDGAEETVDITETDNEISDEDEGAIEIIPETSAPVAETEAVGDGGAAPAEATPDAQFEIEEVSWFGGIKKFLSTPAVYADEVLADEVMDDDINNLEDLGKFSNAKIGFSLALLRQGSGEQAEDETATETESGPENGEEETASDDVAPVEDGNTTDDGEGEVAEDVSGDEEISEELPESTPEVLDEGGVEIIDLESGFLAPEPGIGAPESESAAADDPAGEPITEATDNGGQAEDSGPVSLLELYRILAAPKAAQAESLRDNAKIIIWYSLDSASTTDEAAGSNNRIWQELDVLSADNLSNAENNGYFSYAADWLTSWDDIKNLKLKFEGVVNEATEFTAYLDSVWVEAEYESEDELDLLEKRKRWEEALTLLSDELTFSVNKEGEMAFRYKKNENRIWDTLGEIIGLGDFWKDVDIRAVLIDSAGAELDYPLTLIFEESGEFTIKLPEVTDKLKPGKYSIKFYITDRSGEETEEFELKQDFSWGVLAMNFNKSVYAPSEEGYIQMAVLDESGHTICGASLELRITNLESEINETLSTENGGIKISSECGPESITNKPDYYAYYEFAEAGEYEFTLRAGEKEISEVITVEENRLFDIERAGPTRIYPKADYGMIIRVRPIEDFKGDITETVPMGFKITNYELRIVNDPEKDAFGSNYKYYENSTNDKKELVWQDLELTAGDELEISYTFDAPDRSPELYLVGPLSLMSNVKGQLLNVASEARKWQIASDAVRKRARTVMFAAGDWSETAAGTGRTTNVDYTFSAFNWRLAETGVDIKNAFILFESQFEAYVNNTGSYTGYKLGFDSCDETCAAAAFGTGDGQILDNNSNILAYDDTGSNNIRLLFDVTDEADILNYTGGGAEMESQIGYHIKYGSTVSSIASAKAILVLTYTYDIDSENITNTVAYPLDSTNGTDNGSRQASQAACTADNNCPTFEYNVEIPEWPGIATSTNRVSQWFKFFNHNDGNAANDLNPYIDIQTFNVDSTAFHYECFMGGTQGNSPMMLWPDWTNSGYAENSSQQVEFYINTGTNFSIGGEVFETYIASSSAPTKTRTAAFPIGVINTGNNLNLTSGEAIVYFPENGTSTGVVDIKSAWVRIISHNYNNGAANLTVSTKAGSNATSSGLVYAYNGGATVPRPTINIVHIIPSVDYAELESANVVSGKTVKVNTQYDSANYSGLSAELVITYTYTDETEGYLTSLSLFGGQSTEAPITATTTRTANSILPESGSKTIYAGGLYASFFNSANGGIAGMTFLLDADLSTGAPSCTPSYQAMPDAVNSYAEMYVDVRSALNTTDNQSYNACYADDESLSANDGAKMNGILSYTYGWENSAPTSSFIIASTTAKRDGSGKVDIGIEADDPDDQDIRAKIEFATGTTCVFSPAGDPVLDETDGNITADWEDPYIDNSETYQVGTADGYIVTASGSNSVFFDWQARESLGAAEGDYCLRLTANDLNLDQATPATTTVYVDTKNPTAPGALSLSARTGATTTLAFGATTTETNFREYKIYYQIYDGTDPTETDSVFSSSSDAKLGDKFFNSLATTSIGNLSPKQTYSFAIWAYDDYGNRASSSRVDIMTNDAPEGGFNFSNIGQRTDGSGIVDVSIEVDDANNDDTCRAKIEYVEGADCDFSSALDPSLDSASITRDYGLAEIDNNYPYQIGTSSSDHWILTLPGSNTITFDWFGKTNEPYASSTYCLRLTINDGLDDQLVATTVTLSLDNYNPTAPGILTQGDVTINTIKLIFNTAAPSTDTNEPTTNAYKIFYKKGAAGVVDYAVGDNLEHDDAALNSYDYNGVSSTTLSGLDADTWYYFNIWSYDTFGNKATSTEIAIKTNSTVSIDSLTFTNPETSNIAIAGTSTPWNFRVVVSETNGYQALASTTLRLADNLDSVSPFSDLVFYWNQTTDSFYESGNDALDSAVLSGASTSTCAGMSCTLDFKILFNKTFALTSTNYTAEVMTGNDSNRFDSDSYADIFQVRFPYVEQVHYRWRNDDGGE